jgi:Na+/H+-translocating membrane pyrophosphatase
LHVAVVSELVVVFALCVCSVVAVASHARSLIGSSSGGRAQRREIERLLAAVERAGSEFLSRETRLLGVLLGLLAVALCVPLLLWRLQQPHAAARLVASVLGLVLGGAAGAALARLTHWAAARATARALAAVQEEPESASSSMFRGALLLALAVDVASSVLSCLAFVGYHRYASWVLQLSPSLALQEATRGAPVVALGAIAAALVFQVGGSSFQTAAGVQAAAVLSHGGTRQRHSSLNEEQNPALVAELVGDHVGGLITRSTDAFAALMLANVALLALSGAVVGANPALSELAALALVALPLLVRATGLVAAVVATSSLRIGPGLLSWQTFAAAGASQAAVAATGLLGAAFWLLGAPLYLRVAGAGLLGILASQICQALLLAPRGASSLTAFPTGPAAAATSLARALGLGLQRAWAPLLVAVICLVSAHALGAHTGLSHGSAYTLLLAVAGLTGSAALHLCCSAFSSIAGSVRRLGALRRAHYDLAARSRAAELERVGVVIGNLGDIQAILCGTAAALLGALTLPLLDGSRPPLPLAPASASGALSPALPSAAHPIVIVGVLLGLASLSFYVGGVLQNGSRAASAADEELAREREALGAELDSQTSTSYRGSVVRAGRAATSALLPLAATALLAPMALGVLLRLLYGPQGSTLAGQGLMAVASIAVLTGGCAALVAKGAWMALGHTWRSSATGASTESVPAMHSAADVTRGLIGHAVGPAALLGLKATVISALVIVPLLSPSTF